MDYKKVLKSIGEESSCSCYLIKIFYFVILEHAKVKALQDHEKKQQQLKELAMNENARISKSESGKKHSFECIVCYLNVLYDFYKTVTLL